MQPEIMETIKQILVIITAVMGSGMVTTVLTEVCKVQAIKIPAQRYPRVTAIIMSLVVSACAVLMLNMVVLNSLLAWIVFAAATVGVSFKVYDVVKQRISELKA